MSKNPEDRYQGTFGLKEDLKICLNQWLRIRRLTNFELGRQDRVDKSATAHTTRHNNNRSKIAPTIWPGT